MFGGFSARRVVTRAEVRWYCGWLGVAPAQSPLAGAPACGVRAVDECRRRTRYQTRGATALLTVSNGRGTPHSCGETSSHVRRGASSTVWTDGPYAASGVRPVRADQRHKGVQVQAPCPCGPCPRRTPVAFHESRSQRDTLSGCHGNMIEAGAFHRIKREHHPGELRVGVNDNLGAPRKFIRGGTQNLQ